MVSNPKNQYLKTQVLTASPEQLVLMLFDGAIRFCESARKGWQDNDIETGHKAMIRAQEIVLELNYSLNREKGAEIAENMAKLYGYCYRQMVEANIQHSEELLDPVQHILRELRESWVEAMAKAGDTDQANAGTSPAVTPIPKQPPNPGSSEGAPPQAEEAPHQATEHSSISVQG